MATISFNYAKAKRVVLSQNETGQWRLHYCSPLMPAVLLEVQRLADQPFELLEVDAGQFQTLLTTQYDPARQSAQQMAADVEEALDLSALISELPNQADLFDEGEEAPVIRLLNALLSQAIKQHASDVHVEVFEKDVAVRFRIDGLLQEIVRLQRGLAPLIVSRIKVMSQLDIAEKRLPQDGRLSLKIAGRAVDVRVSILPTAHGERIVLRILDKQKSQLNLTQLGMQKTARDTLLNIIKKPHGILLVTGPTGSGKTTTLYASLMNLNETSRNILTVEDPIEYDLVGIGQTQVNSKVEMSFARGLRSILRQDPDVVMVGEIRDVETAKVAVQASLTGHLVLSTLHTNSAIGAITRLRDMGVEPFLLASSLIGVAAQRLVRVLCAHCKEAYHPSSHEAAYFKAQALPTGKRLYRPCGCEDCRMQGYRGRMGIYEVIDIDHELKGMIHDDASEQALVQLARQRAPDLETAGMDLVLQGLTSLEEVLRVTGQKIIEEVSE